MTPLRFDPRDSRFKQPFGALKSDETMRLRVEVDPALLAFMRTAYIGFQIGCWRMAADAQAGEEAARCERRVDWYARRLRAPAPAGRSRHQSSGGGQGRHRQGA